MERHCQTYQLKTLDASCGTSSSSQATQATTVRSQRVQVNTKYTSNLPFQGVEKSGPWIDSAADYLKRNQAILQTMQHELHSLYNVCVKPP